MDIKMLLVGFALLLLSGILVGSQTTHSIFNVTELSPVNFMANANSFNYTSININSSGMALGKFTSSAAIDFYVLTNSSFAAMMNRSSDMEGYADSSAAQAVLNSTIGTFPEFPNVTNSSQIKHGMYYLVFFNNNNKSAYISINKARVSLNQNAVDTSGASLYAENIPALLFFTAGVIIMAYAVMKPKKSAQNVNTKFSADINELYSQYSKGTPKKARRTSKKAGSRHKND